MAFDPGRDRLATDRDLDPFEELEEIDLKTELAALDEEVTMFDPDEHPKHPDGSEEGVTDADGERSVDIMLDTPPIEGVMAFGLSDEDLRAFDIEF